MAERNLSWVLSYAPDTLQFARSLDGPLGASVAHLLPDDYVQFVAEVGYPILGTRYYDRSGISFLPSQPMEVVSSNLPDEQGDWPHVTQDAITQCLHAFFCGYDLSDIEGVSFGPDGLVWSVERGMPRQSVGTFTHWASLEIDRQRERLAVEYIEEIYTEADPHRLLDYALGASEKMNDEDRRLHWVEHQVSTPYSFTV